MVAIEPYYNPPISHYVLGLRKLLLGITGTAKYCKLRCTPQLISEHNLFGQHTTVGEKHWHGNILGLHNTVYLAPVKSSNWEMLDQYHEGRQKSENEHTLEPLKPVDVKR